MIKTYPSESKSQKRCYYVYAKYPIDKTPRNIIITENNRIIKFINIAYGNSPQTTVVKHIKSFSHLNKWYAKHGRSYLIRQIPYDKAIMDIL